VIRSTIDFGIDLGTTNSAIAVLDGVSTRVFKNNDDADITPSAVSIDKNGNRRVGQRARNRSIEYPDDTYAEFKRRMGTDYVYKFRSSGQTRRPEELSAEILKSLRNDVQQRSGELIEAAVITVPAAFELHQCDATRKAAQLADFKESPLVQEPVAGALAYGFQVDGAKTYWLVYDFGGGTFDAAVIKSEEGTIHVVNHGGDNFLGGSDIDWAIVEKVLVPRILQEFTLDDFTRGNKQWDRAFRKLKRSAEIAKIDLSRAESTTLEPVKFASSSGEEIEYECELKRNEVVSAAEPFIRKSVEIAKRVLKEKNLDRGAIEKVILVGGPTLAPYFREMLSANLGITIDYSVDPLTVVARGAAIFAGTQRLNLRRAAPVAAGEYVIDLKHKAVGMDSAPMVGGKVSGSSTRDFTGFAVEFVNSKTQWRSGKIPLRANGVFTANLHAERRERNVFTIELYDASGRKQKTRPDLLTYTIGAVVDEQPLINSMGIALANNEYAKFFEKGSGLPQRKTWPTAFRTVNMLKQGQSGEVIWIPVVEGENELADRNRLIKRVPIEAKNIRRDLPAGSEVEITLKIDESRLVWLEAYVPMLDEDFKFKIDLGSRTTADAEFLREDFQNEMRRFRQVQSKAAPTESDGLHKLVKEVEDSPLIQEINEALAVASTDPDAAAKCEKLLLQFKLKLDKATDALEWPSLKSEAHDWLGWLQKVADDYGTDKQRQKVGEFAKEVDEIVLQRKPDRLRKRLEQIIRLHFEIVSTQAGWWVYQFQQAEKQQQKMADQDRASRLLGQGRECVIKNNLIGLQNVVRQLWDLLPDEAVQAAQRGYGAGLVH
jgi:molecular chaperone DnaK